MKILRVALAMLIYLGVGWIGFCVGVVLMVKVVGHADVTFMLFLIWGGLLMSFQWLLAHAWIFFILVFLIIFPVCLGILHLVDRLILGKDIDGDQKKETRVEF